MYFLFILSLDNFLNESFDDETISYWIKWCLTQKEMQHFCSITKTESYWLSKLGLVYWQSAFMHLFFSLSALLLFSKIFKQPVINRFIAQSCNYNDNSVGNLFATLFNPR